MKKEHHNILRIILLLLFVTSFSADVKAKLIETESLLLKVIESYREVSQLYMELKVNVYDPEALIPLDEESESEVIPYEVTGKSYLQKVIWRRDEFQAIESLDLQGRPLHFFYLEYPDMSFSKNLQEIRIFEIEDVRFPHIGLYTKHLGLLRKHLFNWGIPINQIKMEQNNFQNIYKLGTTNENVIINPNSYRIIEINKLIHVWGRYYPINIQFSKWDSEKARIPFVTEFFVNSRLFKRISVIKIRFRSINFYYNSMLEKYRTVFPDSEPFSIEIDHGQ